MCFLVLFYGVSCVIVPLEWQLWHFPYVRTWQRTGMLFLMLFYFEREILRNIWCLVGKKSFKLEIWLFWSPCNFSLCWVWRCFQKQKAFPHSFHHILLISCAQQADGSEFGLRPERYLCWERKRLPGSFKASRFWAPSDQRASLLSWIQFLTEVVSWLHQTQQDRCFVFVRRDQDNVPCWYHVCC